MKGRFLLVALLLLGTGCYRTTVRSGLPPGTAAENYENRWHSGWLLGAVQSSGPHKLAELCPDGWAEVHTRGNFVTGLITLATSGIYAPHQITVVCGSVPGPAPVSGYPPLPRPTATTAPPPHSFDSPPPPPPPRQP
jgi:hypothetical protein